MKIVGKALKIAGIGLSCAIVGLVGLYTWVGVGVTMNERAEDHENYAQKVYDMTKTGYKKLWEEVSK